MIEVNHISKQFDGKQVLQDITTRFIRGKNNLIIGQSGSGKTVLLKCIIGLYIIDEGDILFEGKSLMEMDPASRKNLRKEFGTLFQGGALFSSLTVEENVMFPLTMNTAMDREEKLERVNFCLKRVRLENANKLYPSQLSGGMTKRVAIARAISLNPKYLFCDEPNSGLDPSTANVIDKLINEITEEYQITTIVNTHDMNSVMEIGDQVAFIYQGQLWWEGSRNDILQSSNKELNDFVFATELTKKLKHKSA
ncbi:MAG TPA: ATP-binding cassette domain-containing protein [Bacteroidales bacterium]|nr:ATP-binding cassette domain-containing protein [Bacteroidales bacterium]HRZ20274.1 ATP-binding cassette domain-containing protein [Bacteroidales bacterium]